MPSVRGGSAGCCGVWTRPGGQAQGGGLAGLGGEVFELDSQQAWSRKGGRLEREGVTGPAGPAWMWEVVARDGSEVVGHSLESCAEGLSTALGQ